MTTAVVAAIAGAILLAGFVQGALGFGFGLTAMALLPLLLGVKGAVPVVAVYGGLVNTILLVRFRHHLDLRAAAPLVAGTFLGIPVGVWLLRSLDPSILTLTLGVLVGGYVLHAVRQGGRVPELGSIWGGGLGLVSGVLGGAFSTGGPPAVVWVSSKPWGPPQIRATLLATFTVIGWVQVGLFLATGMVETQVFEIGAFLLPAAAIGSFLGARTGDRIAPERFKKVMLGALAIVALSFVLRGARGL